MTQETFLKIVKSAFDCPELIDIRIVKKSTATRDDASFVHQDVYCLVIRATEQLRVKLENIAIYNSLKNEYVGVWEYTYILG